MPMQNSMNSCGPDEMLSVRGMNKHFGRIEALSNVGFTIFAGEILGLIGPNGAGKTTLLECLCGLQPATAGEVLWQGHALPPEQRRSTLFYVPDGITPYSEHTLGQVLTFFQQVYSDSGKDSRDIIDCLHLSSMLECPVGQLSKGWRRRLLLAIGLLAPHPILAMDEPFDGLDLRQTREVMALLRKVVSQGRTLLLSIHQLKDAERICDRFVLLSAGRVAGEGSLEELRRIAAIENGGLEEVFLALS